MAHTKRRILLGGVGGSVTAGQIAQLGLGATLSVTTNAVSPFVIPGGVSAVRYSPGTNGAITFTLPSASVGTCVDGQIIVVNSFDTGMSTIIVQPAAGDDIEAGSAHYMSTYASFVVLKARVAAGLTHWTYMASNTRCVYNWPLHPALVANMAAVPLGAINIQGGVLNIRAAWLACSALLTAGTLTVNFGTPGLTSAHSLSPAVGSSASGSLLSPGNGNWLTVPSIAGASTPSSTYLPATVTTNGTFAGPTDMSVGIETF